MQVVPMALRLSRHRRGTEADIDAPAETWRNQMPGRATESPEGKSVDCAALSRVEEGPVHRRTPDGAMGSSFVLRLRHDMANLRRLLRARWA